MHPRSRLPSALPRAPRGSDGARGARRRRPSTSWSGWLVGWLCVTLLCAQAAGRLHGIAHADWHGEGSFAMARLNATPQSSAIRSGMAGPHMASPDTTGTGAARSETSAPTPAPSTGAGLGAGHDCRLFDASALASGLVAAAPATATVIPRPSTPLHIAAPSPDLPTRLAFRSQAPPAARVA